MLVGAAQVTSRSSDPLSAPGPWDLLEEVAVAAARDVTSKPLLSRLSHTWLVHSITLGHHDWSVEFAQLLGASSADSRYGGAGGAGPQWLVNRAADLVLEGQRPVVMIAGVETLATKRRLQGANALDHLAAWHKEMMDKSDAVEVPATWPPYKPYLHPIEMAHGLDVPTQMYTMIESSIAHYAGRGPAEHRKYMGQMMERFNSVAATNPHSWFSTRRDALELITAAPENRWVNFPYTKYLCAAMDVNMAAALIVTDLQTARSFGVGDSEVAYVRGWHDASETWHVAERSHIHRSKAIGRCGRTALGQAGITADEITAFDLYSCFPTR